MDATDHGKVVLAAILPRAERPQGDRDFLQFALRRLSAIHFTDSTQARLLGMIESYLDQTGQVMPRPVIGDSLRVNGAPPGTVLLYEQYYDALCGFVSPVAPRHSVEQLRALAAERMTAEGLARAMEILTRGYTEGKREYRGAADARDWMLARFADIDRELHQQDAPEGDMRTEEQAIREEYARRVLARRSGRSTEILTGIPELDEKIGGLQPGELDLVGGFTTVGKTSLCVQIAWSTAIEQHRNVVIFTTETLRPQIRVKVIARHSRMAQFGLPDGLNSRDIKSGMLSQEHQSLLFRMILPDFTRNPEYGRLYVAQVPRGATIGTIEARAARLARTWPADLIIIDYLQLLQADGLARSAGIRERQVTIVQEAKQLATTYLDGRGVPVISPWQMGRAGKKEADSGKLYGLEDLSETQEASNIADLILSLQGGVTDLGSDGRRQELKLHVLKNRDGERGGLLDLTADYATSLFTARSAADASYLEPDAFGSFGEDPLG